ncbi:hypothetical protein BG58_28650 [Caballeronia jiangsuensis]|nr:hypothetical protein BG58_28650 [Caballeronia jiangsuensis]KWU19243.1 hypothetical protein AS149_13475 [Burkholderia cenocepacia]
MPTKGRIVAVKTLRQIVSVLCFFGRQRLVGGQKVVTTKGRVLPRQAIAQIVDCLCRRMRTMDTQDYEKKRNCNSA